MLLKTMGTGVECQLFELCIVRGPTNHWIICLALHLKSDWTQILGGLDSQGQSDSDSATDVHQWRMHYILLQ